MRLSSHLSLELWRAGEAHVVSAHGDIDLSTLAKATAALDAARPGAGAGGVLILDMRRVGFMDTSGLRLVIEEQRRAARAGYRFAVVRGPSRVQRLFEIAGLAGDDAQLFLDAPTEPAGGGRG